MVIGKPGAELIDLNAAARLSDYSFLNQVKLTGKVGARRKPTTEGVIYTRG